MQKVIDSRQTTLGRFTVTLDTIEKNGQKAPYSFVSIKPGVTVIPFVDEANVLLLCEYRYPIKSDQYEFPSGMIDEGEKPQDAAIRELKEETGYTASDIIDLGFTYPSFGSTTEKIYLYACKADQYTLPAKELLEDIRTTIVKIDELEMMMRKGLFRQSAGEAAWLRWKLRKND